MAILSKQELIDALTRLGQLAAAQQEHIQLLLFGGGVMVLYFEARQSTRDVDVLILSPGDASKVRALAKVVAEELGWPEDWLNDAAKGYLVGITRGPTVLSKPGIEVLIPTLEQLLAMKLCAWRDDVDISDARRLLREIQGDYNGVWSKVSAHLQTGRELKARYAFDDLWEELHGQP